MKYFLKHSDKTEKKPIEAEVAESFITIKRLLIEKQGDYYRISLSPNFELIAECENNQDHEKITRLLGIRSFIESSKE